MTAAAAIQPAQARPFIRWAGGKGTLVEQLAALLPERINTYYEPFLGGAALFWHLSNSRRFRHAALGDTNAELITTYGAVQCAPGMVIRELDALAQERSASDFLRIRSMNPDTLPLNTVAARFVYLNKLGFNGLYRVNRRGEFNVPPGKFARPPALYDRDNLLLCAKALQHATPTCVHYAGLVRSISAGDAVYFDPPYIPVSKSSNFTSYTRDGFSLTNQAELAAECRRLRKAGVHVLASNSDTPQTRELYQGFELHEVQVRRNINSKGNKRGAVPELIIVGRP